MRRLAEDAGLYLASLPERAVRSAAALAAGFARGITGVTLPLALRRTRLYRNLVDNTLRFLIEQVGQVENAYPEGGALASDFAVRRAAGNGIELVGILAFRASPVWVMAALADLSGAGRTLIREIAAELKREGLLDPENEFETADALLEGLEKFGERAAETINTPPIDTAALRQELNQLRRQAATLGSPAIDSLDSLWRELNHQAQAQGRSVLAVSSALALSSLRAAPSGLWWLGRGAPVAARRAGELAGEALLGHYRDALGEIARAGFVNYWTAEFSPYIQAAGKQFAPSRPSATERFLANGLLRRRQRNGERE